MEEVTLHFWLRELIEPGMVINREYARRLGWAVVPVESGAHFDADDIRLIGKAMQIGNVRSFNAMLIEDVAGVDQHLTFEASMDGLRQFNKKCAHFSYALFPTDKSWLVVCTTCDFFLLCGSNEFVQSATESLIGEALDSFAAFADESGEPRLIGVSKLYGSG